MPYEQGASAIIPHTRVKGAVPPTRNRKCDHDTSYELPAALSQVGEPRYLSKSAPLSSSYGPAYFRAIGNQVP